MGGLASKKIGEIMFNKKLPIVKCNAEIEEKKYRELCKFGMLRFEEMFDLYSTEPNSFSIELEESSEPVCLEEILRVRKIEFKGEALTCGLYADDTESPKKILIHYVKWDMEKDRSIMMSNKKELLGENFLSYCPNVIVNNICVTDDRYYSCLLERIKAIDEVVSDGIELKDNENPDWRWKDIELLRNFYWGQVRVTWNTTKKNRILEKEIDAYLKQSEKIVNSEMKRIKKCTAYYSSLFKEVFED